MDLGLDGPRSQAGGWCGGDRPVRPPSQGVARRGPPRPSAVPDRERRRGPDYVLPVVLSRLVCALARSPGCASTTSTGARRRRLRKSRAGAGRAFRYLTIWGRQWWPTQTGARPALRFGRYPAGPRWTNADDQPSREPGGGQGCRPGGVGHSGAHRLRHRPPAPFFPPAEPDRGWRTARTRQWPGDDGSCLLELQSLAVLARPWPAEVDHVRAIHVDQRLHGLPGRSRVPAKPQDRTPTHPVRQHSSCRT